METQAGSPSQDVSKAAKDEGVLRQTLHLYRRHFSKFVWTFTAPAAAHCAWIEGQRLLNHARHPTWPQEGIVFAPDLGSSIYFLTLVLTCAGALVFLVFAGPAIAAVCSAISAIGDYGASELRPAVVRQSWFRFLNLQLATVLLAWWPFIVAMAAAIVVASTILASAPAVGFDLWYLLLAIAAFAGAPIGVWMTVRYAVAVPAMFWEGLGIDLAIKRSERLTKGVTLRILAVLALAAGARWLLGFAANVSLGAFARAVPAAATVEAFVLIPLLAFALDLLIGPLLGIAVALFYRERALESGFGQRPA
jgi:hypothetical protein